MIALFWLFYRYDTCRKNACSKVLLLFVKPYNVPNCLTSQLDHYEKSAFHQHDVCIEVSNAPHRHMCSLDLCNKSTSISKLLWYWTGHKPSHYMFWDGLSVGTTSCQLCFLSSKRMISIPTTFLKPKSKLRLDRLTNINRYPVFYQLFTLFMEKKLFIGRCRASIVWCFSEIKISKCFQWVATFIENWTVSARYPSLSVGKLCDVPTSTDQVFEAVWSSSFCDQLFGSKRIEIFEESRVKKYTFYSKFSDHLMTDSNMSPNIWLRLKKCQP